MTPSKYIKSQGLPNLQYVANKVGKHRDTLNNWHKHNFPLFEAVVAGVLARDKLEMMQSGIDAALLGEALEEKIDE